MPRLNQRRRTTFTTPITSTVLMPVPEAEHQQVHVHRISPSSSIGSEMNQYHLEDAFAFPDVTKLVDVNVDVDRGMFDEHNNSTTSSIASTAVVSLSDGLSELTPRNDEPMLLSRKSGLTRSKSMKHGLSDLASISSSSYETSATKRRLNSMYFKESDKLALQDDHDHEEVDATWGHFVEHNNISRTAAAFDHKSSNRSLHAPYSIKATTTVRARRCFGSSNPKRSNKFHSQHAKQMQHYQASTAVDEYFHALSL